MKYCKYTLLPWLLFSILILPGLASAHRASDGLLWIDSQADGFAIRWDVAIRDLEGIFALDRNWDAEVSWAELSAARTELMDYARTHISVASDRSCIIQPAALQVAKYPDGGYAVLNLAATGCRSDGSVRVTYAALFAVDPGHRGLLQLRRSDGTQSAVAAPGAAVVTFAADVSNGSTFVEFLREGVWHVWIGFDHVLFLLSLLLPCVLFAVQGRRDGLFDSLRAIVGVVTAFTLGHSVTLGLAATGLVVLPPRLVESVIALSVALAALNNLYPVVTRRRWVLAAGFGLIHGFGFAGVLAELSADSSSLLVTLAGFNVGVELGQLAIVMVVMPIAWAIRRSWVYQQAIVRGGSIAVAVLGVMWAYERALT